MSCCLLSSSLPRILFLFSARLPKTYQEQNCTKFYLKRKNSISLFANFRHDTNYNDLKRFHLTKNCRTTKFKNEAHKKIHEINFYCWWLRPRLYHNRRRNIVAVARVLCNYNFFFSPSSQARLNLNALMRKIRHTFIVRLNANRHLKWLILCCFFLASY